MFLFPILFLLLVPCTLFAQNVGDYRSAVSPKGFWDQASSWEQWDGSSWVKATSVPSATNDVYIVEGDTIDIGGNSSGSCKNLFIEKGGVLTSTNNNRSVTVNGGLIQCDGEIYCDGSTYRPMLQWSGTNCVLQGTGSVTLYRVRPASGGANYSFTFDMDATVLNGGVYSNNVSNVTFIVGEKKRLTLNNSYFGGASSKTGNVSNSFSIVINGIVDITNTSALNLNCTGLNPVSVTVNGRVFFDKTTSFVITDGGPSITVNGEMTVSGKITLSDLRNQIITGTGVFELTDGATFTIVGYRYGLDSENGPIRMKGCNFSPLANYVLEGSGIEMSTGPDFPKSVVSLTVKDSLSVIFLTNDLVVDSFLVFGQYTKIRTHDKKLILGGGATVVGAKDSSFVEGTVVATIDRQGDVVWPVGLGHKYLPAVLKVSSVTVPGQVGIKAADYRLEPFSREINEKVLVFHSYYKVTEADPIQIEPKSLILSYDPSLVPDVISHTQLQGLNSGDEGGWWKLEVMKIDSVNGTMEFVGDMAPTEFVIIGPAGILRYELAGEDTTDFGSVECGSSKDIPLLITNDGNAECSIDSIKTFSNEFSVDYTPTTIPPGEQAKVRIIFSPKGLGLRVGTLAVYSSGAISTVDSGEIMGVGTEMKIRDARKLAVGDEVFLKGVVTRTKGAYTFFQDSTGGMCIYGTRGTFYDSVMTGYITPGSELFVRGKLYEYKGLLEMRTNYDIIEWKKLDEKPIPKPIITSLADISANGEQYESMVVTIPDISIVESSDLTFTASTNYNIVDPTDQTKSVIFRIQAARDCELVGTSIPTAPFTYVGVVAQFSSTGVDGYQLQPVYLTDIQIQTDVEKTDVVSVPTTYVVYPAYPNPFNPATTVKYGVPTRSTVTVRVYSILGQEVATLYNGVQTEGYHTLSWSASGMASGIYFIKVSAQALDGNATTFNHIMKVVLMK